MSNTLTMKERIARACFDFEHAKLGVKWADCRSEDRQYWLKNARAVLAEMAKGATEGMIDAGNNEGTGCPSGHRFIAMIKSAMEE